MAFSLSTQQLVCLANCTKKTVVEHRKRLLELGLLVKVSYHAIPPEARHTLPHRISPNFYALPELTASSVRVMLTKLRKS